MYFIVFVSGNHFVLAHLNNEQDYLTFEIIDSLGKAHNMSSRIRQVYPNLINILDTLRRFIAEQRNISESQIKYLYRDSVQQKNGFNCGFHTMYNMFRLLSGKGIHDYEEKNISLFRYILLLFIFKRRVTSMTTNIIDVNNPFS